MLNRGMGRSQLFMTFQAQNRPVLVDMPHVEKVKKRTSTG